MAEAPSVSTSTDCTAASGIWFRSTKPRPPRAPEPLSATRRPLRSTSVERLRREAWEPPAVLFAPTLEFVAPRFPLPAKIGIRFCRTSRRLVSNPVESKSARPRMVTGAASATRAVGIFEPVTTNFSKATVSPLVDAAVVEGFAWAKVSDTARRAVRVATSERAAVNFRVRMFMVLSVGCGLW